MKRIKWFQDRPKSNFVYDIKLFDIGNTLVAAIMNLPDNCVAISVSKHSDVELVTRAAKRKGIRIFWSRKF